MEFTVFIDRISFAGAIRISQRVSTSFCCSAISSPLLLQATNNTTSLTPALIVFIFFFLFVLHCSVYHSSGPSKLEWKLCQNQLVCSSWKICELSVRVLSEELAYNKSLRQFKIFITERPLDPNHKASLHAHVFLRPAFLFMSASSANPFKKIVVNFLNSTS